MGRSIPGQQDDRCSNTRSLAPWCPQNHPRRRELSQPENGYRNPQNPACKRRQNQATLTPVRTLEFTVSSGAITAKTPGANTPKGDSLRQLGPDCRFGLCV